MAIQTNFNNKNGQIPNKLAVRNWKIMKKPLKKVKCTSSANELCSNCGQYHTYKQAIINQLIHTSVVKFKDFYKK